jgi:hypothetical protein
MVKTTVSSIRFAEGCGNVSKALSKRSPGLRTSCMSFWTLREMYNIRLPTISCIGIIQDFLRPMRLKKTESTIGDHSSLSEYG